jgi:hypothetical protein
MSPDGDLEAISWSLSEACEADLADFSRDANTRVERSVAINGKK